MQATVHIGRGKKTFAFGSEKTPSQIYVMVFTYDGHDLSMDYLKILNTCPRTCSWESTNPLLSIEAFERKRGTFTIKIAYDGVLQTTGISVQGYYD